MIWFAKALYSATWVCCGVTTALWLAHYAALVRRMQE